MSASAIPLDIEYITEAQARDEWRRAWSEGKHGEWGDKPEADYFPGAGRDEQWVMAYVPMDWLFFDWQMEENEPSEAKMRRARSYAERSGDLPPGVALLNERTVRRLRAQGEPVRASVQDGNHRGLAATIRGEPDFAVMMPRSDFERLVAERG